MKEIQRGEIYFADLSPIMGSEQDGFRPVLIIQNDLGNRYSPTTIVSAITSQRKKTGLPTHVRIDVAGLTSESIVLAEQLRTLDKCRLGLYIDRLDFQQMEQVDKALKISLALLPEEELSVQESSEGRRRKKK